MNVANLKFNTMAMLDVSTAHIPKATADALGDIDYGRFAAGDFPMLWHMLSYVHWHEYGWVIWASEDAVENAMDAGHPELAAVLRFAINGGFQVVKLDCDAANLPSWAGLPVFEW